MRTAANTLIMCALIGCNDIGNGNKEHDSESLTQGDTTVQVEEIVDAIRSQIPRATAMSTDNWNRLAGANRHLQLEEFHSQPLTLAILLSVRVSAASETQNSELQFYKTTPQPSKLVDVMSRTAPKGYCTLVQEAFIKNVTCDVNGDAAFGTITFECPGFYQGAVRYQATSSDGMWELRRFHMPAYHMSVELDEHGTWKTRADYSPIEGVNDMYAAIVEIANDGVVMVNGSESTASSLHVVLRDREEQLRAFGKDPSVMPVFLEISDEAPVSAIWAVSSCLAEARFPYQGFALVLDDTVMPFDLPYVLSEDSEEAKRWPTFIPEIVIAADDLGDISEVRIGEHTFLSFAHARSVLLHEHSGTSMQGTLNNLAFQPDKGLKFAHVKEACRVFGPIARTLWPFGAPGVEIGPEAFSGLEISAEGESVPLEVPPSVPEK